MWTENGWLKKGRVARRVGAQALCGVSAGEIWERRWVVPLGVGCGSWPLLPIAAEEDIDAAVEAAATFRVVGRDIATRPLGTEF